MTSIDAKAAARVIDAMRRGWPVRIEDADGALRLLAVEGAGDGDIADFGAGGLLLSAERAATLKLINQAAAASGPVAIALGDGDVGPRARAIADPTLDMAQPMKGPFRSLALTARGAAAAAVDLARLAHRLPAWYIAADGDGPIDASASVADVAAFVAADGRGERNGTGEQRGQRCGINMDAAAGGVDAESGFEPELAVFPH